MESGNGDDKSQYVIQRGDDVGDNCRPPLIFYNSPKNGVLKTIMRFDTKRYPLDIEMSPCFKGNNAIGETFPHVGKRKNESFHFKQNMEEAFCFLHF